MAGRPVRDKLTRYIEEHGGDDYILDRIASGETPGAIAASISLPGHGTISRPLLYAWRDAGGTERREAWKHAMACRGEGLIEEAGEILDELAGNMPTSAEVSLARERANHRRWLGGKLNEDYSDKPGVDVNVLVSADDQLLAALRKHGQRRALPAPQQEAIEAEYEIEE